MIWSSLNLQVTKTGIKSWTSSNFGQIRTLIAEIVSCICKKQQCTIIFRSSQIRGTCILSVAKLLTNASLLIFDWIINLAGNKDMHKSLQEFDFWHIQTADIVELIGPEKNNCSLTWKLFKIFQLFLLDGSQVSDRCPLGYLFPNILESKYFQK